MDSLLDNWNKYSESISLAIEQLNKRQIVSFGAWSLFPFTKDKEIMKFIASLSNKIFIDKIISFVYSCWDGKQTIEETKNVYEMLIAFKWDSDEIPMEREDSSQGAIDFLGGVEALSEFVLKGNKNDITQGCAYQILFRIDYKIAFHQEDDIDITVLEDIYTKEMKNQLKMIEDISGSQKEALQIERHHEELISIFAKYEGE